MKSAQRTSTEYKQATDFAPLSLQDLAAVHGGAVRVMIDGRIPGTVDEFSLNMEIFKGNIGGPMIV